MHCMRAAASRTFWTAGSRSPMRMAMMAITTNNSISVKAERRRGMGGLREVKKTKKTAIVIDRVRHAAAMRGAHAATGPARLRAVAGMRRGAGGSVAWVDGHRAQDSGA